MNDAMFLILLMTLGLLAVWLASKLDAIKQAIESKSGSDDELKDAIKEAILDALQEHGDPMPVMSGPYEEGYEERLKDWQRRHGHKDD